MSITETNREIAVNDVAESYIRDHLHLSDRVTDWERTLIAGNIRGFWDYAKRLNYRAIQEMRKVLEANKRAQTLLQKQANNDGDIEARERFFVRWQESVAMLCFLDEIEKDLPIKVDYNGWVACKDAMPEDGVEVLVYGTDQGGYEIRGVATSTDDRGWKMCEMSEIVTVTHWMRLPNNPV
jgi:hypothetical protein